MTEAQLQQFNEATGSNRAHKKAAGKLGKGGLGEVVAGVKISAEEGEEATTEYVAIKQTSRTEARNEGIRLKWLPAEGHRVSAKSRSIDSSKRVKGYMIYDLQDGDLVHALNKLQPLKESNPSTYRKAISTLVHGMITAVHDLNRFRLPRGVVGPIAHNDIKPQNFFHLNGVVNIGDYGSMSHGGTNKETASTIGYLSPEQSWGPINKYNRRKNDAFALGVSAQELLNGKIEKIRHPSSVMRKAKHPSIVGDVGRVCQMLRLYDENERWTTDEAVVSDWFLRGPAMSAEDLALLLK